MRRIIYFLFTNFAILIVLSTAMRLFGVEPYLTAYGLNYRSLLIFALVFGMGGSFISLALSKWTAKRLTGAKVIKEPANEAERWLVRSVSELASKSSIGMHEVAVFPSDDMNAFATGVRRNNALVAVSTGLLGRMNRADSGAAALVGKKPMMGALEALKASVRQPHLPDKMAAFGISGSRRRGLAALFATHPDLDDRIATLGNSSYPDYK